MFRLVTISDNVQIFLGQCGVETSGKGSISDSGVTIPISDLYETGDPVSLSAIQYFVGALKSKMHDCFHLERRHLCLCCKIGHDALRHACFLLGSYMILVQNHDAEYLCQRFSHFFRLYPVSSNSESENIGHGFLILDCWRGLQQAWSTASNGKAKGSTRLLFCALARVFAQAAAVVTVFAALLASLSSSSC